MITKIFPTGHTNHLDAAAHPNGESVYLAINKTETKDRKNYYNMKIVEINRRTRKVVRIIREYNQIDINGPVGYCTIQCLPDGALFVGLSITNVDDTSQVIAAFDIIERVIPVFTPGSTNTTNPPPIVDTEARNMAAQALIKASAALTSGTDTAIVITNRLTELTNDIYRKIAALPTKDYVWQNIADRVAAEIKLLGTAESSVFENPLFTNYIRTLAQSVLITALQYAKTNPDQSMLRQLLREVILAEK